MTEIVEFDTDNPERVGKKVVFDIELSDNKLEIIGTKRKNNLWNNWHSQQ